MLYYLVRFIIVDLLLILQAYLSENLFLSVYVYEMFLLYHMNNWKNFIQIIHE